MCFVFDYRRSSLFLVLTSTSYKKELFAILSMGLLVTPISAELVLTVG